MNSWIALEILELPAILMGSKIYDAVNYAFKTSLVKNTLKLAANFD